MVLIAVAGGTGPGLGRNIVTALAANPNHIVIVLSRLTSKTPEWIEELGLTTRKVNYSSLESLADALKGVHTLLSTLLAVDGTWAQAHKNLLTAGIAAGITRFAPADWGMGPETSRHVAVLHPQVEVWEECEKIAAANPSFEWASFHNGMFMNYLGLGSPHPEALAGLQEDVRIPWNVEHMRATIQVNEQGVPASLITTDLRDIGKFVSAACDLPVGQWQRDMGMAGDKKRLDEVVAIIEKVRGKKMDVIYRTKQDIVKEKEAENDPMKHFWLEMEESYTRDAEGEGYFSTPLNDLVGKQFKPVSVEEYLKKYWA